MKPAAAKSWSKLPADIVDYIAEKLYYYADYADQIRFRAVCKIWRSASFPLKLSHMRPWLFSFRANRDEDDEDDEDEPRSSSYIYDTTRKLKYTIKTDQIVLDARNRASKYGWVLFSKTKSTYSFPSSLFFYNPFTAEIIELPELLMASSDKATFSAPPTSSDCTIFVLRIFYSSKKICISSYKPGQKLWTRHLFDGFYGDVEGLVYLKGFLYCSFSNNALCAFEESHKEWKIFRHDRVRPKLLNHTYATGGLIESHDGNLLTLYYNFNEFEWHVFRFDWMRMKWLEVNNLNKRAIFLGGDTSMSVSAVEEASELANTIHSAGKNLCTSYLFKGRKSQKLLCPQSYDWIEDGNLINTWIQPPIWRGNRSIANLLSVTPV